MNLYRLLRTVIVLSLAALMAACGKLEIGLETTGDEPSQLTDGAELLTEAPPPTDIQPTATEEGTSSDSTTQRYTFEELGISLVVPSDLYIKKDPIVNYDDRSRLDSYLFYIQNYGYPGGESSGDFQMYGTLQFSLPTVTWEQFAEAHNNSPGMYAYVNPIEIDGLRGFDAQFSGQRNRFVYLFYLEGHVLSIAVSEPTPENKILADQIIQSLEFIPGGFTDASHVKLVSDPDQLYQILIPDNWEYDFQPTIGMQLTSLEASSPDLEVVVEDVDGPHSNIHYKKGIYLHLQVIEDDSELQIQWPNQREYGVYFNGIEGTVYIYVEPSTVEGELRTVTVNYEGKNYILRFGYAEDADLYSIDRIISSFNITPETFFPTQ